MEKNSCRKTQKIANPQNFRATRYIEHNGQCPTRHLPRAKRPTKIVFDKVLGPVPQKLVKFKPKFKPNLKVARTSFPLFWQF